MWVSTKSYVIDIPSPQQGSLLLAGINWNYGMGM